MIDLTGRKFDQLCVLRAHPERIANCVAWVCRCDCGTECVVSGALLRDGRTRSCGCLRRALGRARGAVLTRKHGEGTNGKETPEYRTWTNMLSRCRNPNHTAFRYYGARGISVCERWGDYTTFLADMGRRPSSQHSLDRIDNTQGYSPENCRWATAVEQNRNTRFNRQIEIDGVARPLVEWLAHFQVARRTFYNRLAQGFTEQEALTRPSQRGASLSN